VTNRWKSERPRSAAFAPAHARPAGVDGLRAAMRAAGIAPLAEAPPPRAPYAPQTRREDGALLEEAARLLEAGHAAACALPQPFSGYEFGAALAALTEAPLPLAGALLAGRWVEWVPSLSRRQLDRFHALDAAGRLARLREHGAASRLATAFEEVWAPRDDAEEE
jgi:hypothetical protein